MRSFLRLANLLLLSLAISGCPSFQLHDFNGGVILPYSEDCFQVGVVSHKEVRTPAAQCKTMVAKGVFLTSADWKILRRDIQDNCQNSQCKQLTGQFDQLFLILDKGLDLAPLP